MGAPDNLNAIGPCDDDGGYKRSTLAATEKVAVHFDDLETRLVRLIGTYPVVVGCVAWLTNERILEALRGKEVAIVVQKEDFLRPDSGRRSKRLHELYGQLRAPERFRLPGVAGRLSVCSDASFEAIRCVGNHNSDKRPAFPRMHHKFCLFGSSFMDFEAVWTGSFNFTHNATQSLENAVVIRDSAIVAAYLGEFGHVFALSEQLDWEQPWCEPEWRIGT